MKLNAPHCREPMKEADDEKAKKSNRRMPRNKDWDPGRKEEKKKKSKCVLSPIKCGPTSPLITHQLSQDIRHRVFLVAPLLFFPDP